MSTIIRKPLFLLLALLVGLAGCLSPAAVGPAGGAAGTPSGNAAAAETAAAPAGASAPQKELALTDAIPADPKALHGTLGNGLAYYIRANHKPEKRAELRLVVNAGSLQEEDSQQGLAHFTEHMAFNGTERFEKSAIVDYLESIGMSFGPEVNAFTSFDETVYRLEIPTDDPTAVETGIRILEQWAHGISFDPEQVDKERPVIVEEWRLRRGAEARMQDVQYPVLFRGSRYAVRLPIGKMDVVTKAPPDELRSFYRDWYRPDLMAVVAVGDFDPAVIETLVRRDFGGIPRPESPRPRLLSEVPDIPGTLYAPATDPEATATRVSLYVKHDPIVVKTVADYRREIVRELYDSSLNSRLGDLSKPPDSPITRGVSGWLRIVRSKDVYLLSSRVRGDRITAALTLLLTESERVKRHGFTETELEREKKDLLTSIERYYTDRENIESSTLAQSYVDNYLQRDPYPDAETEHALYNRFVPQISLGEVNALAGTLLTEDNRVVLVNAPRSQAAAVPAETQVAEVFRTVAASPILAYQDAVSGQPLFSGTLPGAAIVSRTEYKELGVSEWRLANGATVVLKPTDFKKDEVLFGAFAPGGTSLSSDADFVAATTAATIVDESGVGGFDATQLRKLLAGKAASVSPWIGELQQGLRGSARPEDLETLFQLAYLYMTAPRSDPPAFEAYRQRLSTALQNRQASPQALFYDAVQNVLSQDNPRGSSWGPDRVKAMDLDASLRVYRERFRDAAGFRFFLVGSFRPEQVEPLVRTYIGSLPARGGTESWKDTGVYPPKGIVRREVRRGLEPQSRVALMYTGMTPWSLGNQLVVEAMSRILDIRMRETVREGAGGSYDVGVDGRLDHYPREEYTVSINFGCAPDKVDPLIALALEEVKRIRDRGPEAVDVAKVREMLRREHEQNLRENDYWLGSVQMVYGNGLGPRALLGFEERLAGITAETIQRIAVELLRPDTYAVVTLYPEGAAPKK